MLPHILAGVLIALCFLPSTVLGEDAAPAAPRPYPLTTCLVMGVPLGNMGAPLVVVREGREIRLCCRRCLHALDRNLSHYLARLAEAERAHPTP